MSALTILDRLQRLRDSTGSHHSDSPFIHGYREAANLAFRIAKDTHTIIECSNARCGSPVNGLHCWECDEIEVEYDAAHIHEHSDASQT